MPESLHVLTALKPELLSSEDSGARAAQQPIAAHKSKKPSTKPTRARFRMDRTPLYSRARARGEFWAR